VSLKLFLRLENIPVKIMPQGFHQFTKKTLFPISAYILPKKKKKEKSEAQKCCTSKHIWLPHKKTSYHLKSILINTRISSTPLTPKQEDENFHLEIIHSVNFN
jgi:hypothetical protein